jgi:EAL domain-containing protein (putative c-di-GMP-specific phosphodiesterase class I)/ActR/RegA family two-component response regulator
MVARAVGLNVAAFLPMEWLSEFSCDESVRKVNATDDGDSEGTGARRGGLRSLVLLADDDDDFMRACTRMLETWGYEVIQATSGEVALEKAKDCTFDVILSDINLPKASGLEILRAVRSRDRDVPVILMTGGPEMETARLAVEWGAQSYLIKPLSLPQLKGILERTIGAYHLVRRQRLLLDTSEKLAQQNVVLREQFERALGGLWMAFQPIVSWSQKSVVAFEALMRTTDPVLPGPAHMLNAAEALDEIHTLGRKTRGLIAAVLENHRDLPGVFVNLHVLDLLDEELYDPGNRLVPFAQKIHLEITERMAIEKIPDTPARIGRLRKLGYKIAVDDLGEGYSGLNSFADLEPDAVKLDMSLIRGIDRAPTKRRMVQVLANLCRELGTPLVAEGVETEAERATLVELGADWLQGFLFARPDFPFPIPRM